MSGLRLSSSRSILVPDRGLPTTKNGGSARVTARSGSKAPPGLPAVRLFTSGPESRKGGPRAAHPQGPGRQPRRDRPARAADGARHGDRAAWRCTPTPTPARRTCARPTRRCASGRRPAASRTWRSTASSTRRARPAPTPSIPATASSPRTPTSRSAAPAPGLIFIGPPPAAIRAMGSKIEAKRIMAAAGVPVIPGVSGAGLDGRRARARGARGIGFPLLVKASAGGGGKGMRVVRDAAALRGGAGGGAARGARRVRRRHAAGRALRRAPAPRRDPDLRRRPRPRRASLRARVLDPAPLPEGHRGGAVAGGGCRRCARAWAPRPSRRRRPSATSAPARSSSCSRRTAQFYFLEVNTRLQVEHPVTELVTGLDLVRLADRGRGGASAAVRAGRRAARRPRDRGAALRRGSRARLPAGDRHGSLLWEPPALPGVRWDAGVEAGSEVGVHYDPMLAKVIAHGADARRGDRAADATRSSASAWRA